MVCFTRTSQVVKLTILCWLLRFCRQQWPVPLCDVTWKIWPPVSVLIPGRLKVKYFIFHTLHISKFIHHQGNNEKFVWWGLQKPEAKVLQKYPNIYSVPYIRWNSHNSDAPLLFHLSQLFIQTSLWICFMAWTWIEYCGHITCHLHIIFISSSYHP